MEPWISYYPCNAVEYSKNDYDGDPITGKCTSHRESAFLVRSTSK